MVVLMAIGTGAILGVVGGVIVGVISVAFDRYKIYKNERQFNKKAVQV